MSFIADYQELLGKLEENEIDFPIEEWFFKEAASHNPTEEELLKLITQTFEKLKESDQEFSADLSLKLFSSLSILIGMALLYEYLPETLLEKKVLILKEFNFNQIFYDFAFRMTGSLINPFWGIMLKYW